MAALLGIGNWGPHMSKRVPEGVAVERAGKTVSVLPCSNAPTTEFWPDFYETAGIRTNGEEFYLPIDWPGKKSMRQVGAIPSSPQRAGFPALGV